MKELFDWLDKWLSPVRKPTTGEDIGDSLVLFAIMVALLMVIIK
jgi:hypothetical protein